MRKWIQGLLITAFIGIGAYVLVNAQATKASIGLSVPSKPNTPLTSIQPRPNHNERTKTGSPTNPPVSVEKSLLEDLYNGQLKTVDTHSFNKIKAELTPSKMQQLASWSTDIQLSSQTRQSALYVLTQMGEEAIPALTTVATMPLQTKPSRDPHSIDSYRYSEDVGIRITAIEALDNNIHRADLILPAMQMVLNTHKEQSLLLLAQISISGIQSGSPGKVQRAVEAMLKGNE